MYRFRTSQYWAIRLSVSLVVAFFTITSTLANVQIGDQTLYRRHDISNNTLRARAGGAKALRSYAFVGRVGGMAFEETALLPETNLTIRIRYNADEKDGQRITVDMGPQTYHVELYDWQAIPIARYADSEYTAAVSLFGPESSQESFHIVYHPAFEDTLLGLRLLQADLLLIDPHNFSQIPVVDGRPLLGPGEKDYQPDKNALATIDQFSAKFDVGSWVLTDIGRSPTLEIKDGYILVDLKPYYFFWKSDFSGFSNMEELNRLTMRIKFMDLLKETDAEYEHDKARLKELTKAAEDFEPGVVENTSATEWIDDEWPVMERLAPNVIHAVENTAQYAALMRLVKKDNPSNWSAFLLDLTSADIIAVETPNVLPRH